MNIYPAIEIKNSKTQDAQSCFLFGINDGDDYAAALLMRGFFHVVYKASGEQMPSQEQITEQIAAKIRPYVDGEGLDTQRILNADDLSDECRERLRECLKRKQGEKIIFSFSPLK